MIRPGFARWNSRVGFLSCPAVDAVQDGSHELSITFFSCYFASDGNQSFKSEGHFQTILEKGVGQKYLPFLLRNGTELLKRFLRNCNPTPTHVNSKSLIVTLAHPENRRGSSYLLASAANT